jgi:hypothetical protein
MVADSLRLCVRRAPTAHSPPPHSPPLHYRHLARANRPPHAYDVHCPHPHWTLRRVISHLRFASGPVLTWLDSTRAQVLVVTNFLGTGSEPYTLTVRRAAMPVPSIYVAAPPLLTFPASTRLALEARAAIALCFSSSSGTSAITFEWSHVGSTGNTTAADVVRA